MFINLSECGWLWLRSGFDLALENLQRLPDQRVVPKLLHGVDLLGGGLRWDCDWFDNQPLSLFAFDGERPPGDLGQHSLQKTPVGGARERFHGERLIRRK